MAREAFIERMTTRIRVPPGFDASALAAVLDRTARRSLASALEGTAAMDVPDSALLLVRRVALRMRVAAGVAREADHGSVEAAWPRAIREAVTRAASAALARGESVVTDEAALFPSTAALVRPALEAVAAGDRPWWLPAAVDSLWGGAIPPGTRIAGAVLARAASAAPRETAVVLRAFIDRGDLRLVGAVGPATALAASRALLRGFGPPKSDAAGSHLAISRPLLEIALAAVWPAASAWAGQVSTSGLVLAAAVALSAEPEVDDTGRRTLLDLVSALLDEEEAARQRKSGRPPWLRENEAVWTADDAGREASADEVAATGDAAHPAMPVTLGGLLFLIRPVLLMVDQEPDAWMPKAPLPEVLRALGLRVLKRVGAAHGGDLADYDGEAPLLAVLGARPAPRDEAERRALLVPPATAASQWAERAMEALAAGLSEASADADPWAWLVERRGELVLSPERATLTMPLSSVDLALRRGGWDIDPGWTPAIGRIVRFVYAPEAVT